jgi:hypothetical protein
MCKRLIPAMAALFLILVSLASYAVAGDFVYRARLALLLRGYPFATLAPPSPNGCALYPGTIAAFLVYNGKTCIGCIDMSGEPLLAGKGGATLDLPVLLGLVQVLTGVLAVLIVVLSYRPRGERRGFSPIGLKGA